MELEKMVEGYLKVTNTETHITYEQYLVEMANEGRDPVTSKQWDMIICMVGNRTMTSTDIPHNWIKNIKTALNQGES